VKLGGRIVTFEVRSDRTRDLRLSLGARGGKFHDTGHAVTVGVHSGECLCESF
jgi:hypothetical protein